MNELPTREQLKDFRLRTGLETPEKGGVISELGSGLAHGAIQTIGSLASTAKEAGVIAPSTERAVQEWTGSHQQFAPPSDYSPSDLSAGGIARTVGTGISQAALPVAAAIGGTAVTGNPLLGAAAAGVTTWAQIYGDEVKDMKTLTKDEDTAKMLGGLSTLGQSIVMSVSGPELLFSGLAKKVAVQTLKDVGEKFSKSIVANALVGGSTGGSGMVASYFTSQLIKNLGKEGGAIPEDVQIPETSFNELSNRFLGGAIPGVVLGGVSGIKEKFKASKESPATENKIAENKNTFEDTNATEEGILQHRQNVTDQINQALGKNAVELNNVEIVTPKMEGEISNNPLVKEISAKLADKNVNPVYYYSLSKKGQDIDVISKDNNAYVNVMELQKNPEKVLKAIEQIKPIEAEKVQAQPEEQLIKIQEELNHETLQKEQGITSEAEEDWNNNYAEKVASLEDQRATLQDKLKTAKKAESILLKPQLKEVNKKLADIEDEFLNKWQPKEEVQNENAVEEPGTEVMGNQPESGTEARGQYNQGAEEKIAGEGQEGKITMFEKKDSTGRMTDIASHQNKSNGVNDTAPHSESSLFDIALINKKSNSKTSTPSSMEKNPISSHEEVNKSLEEQRKNIQLPKFNAAETDARINEEIKAKPEEFANKLATTAPTTPEAARAYQVFFHTPEAQEMARNNTSKFIDIGFNAFDLRHLSGQMLAAWHRINKSLSSGPQEAKSLLVSLLAKPSQMYEKEVATMGKEKAVVNEKARIENIVKQIEKKYGVNPLTASKLDLTDYKKTAGMIQDIKSAKKSAWTRGADIVLEYWMNAILSGIKTHMANIVGNTAFTAVELGPQRLMEATVGGVINVVSGGKFAKNAASFTEWAGMMKNIAQSFKPAFKAARDAFKNEATNHTVSKLEFESGAIPNKGGEIVRVPFRLLLAEDEFAKHIIRNVESQAMAYRRTYADMKQEGKNIRSPEGKTEFQKRMTEELNNPDSYSNIYAENRALELTFQEELSGALKWIDKARQSKGITGTILKFMFPFVKTPWNIARIGVRKSPLGTIGMALDLATGKYKTHPDIVVPRISEQVLAWTTTAMLVSMLGNEDKEKEPWITGSAPRYGTGEYTFKATNVPPMSIRIGDNWYNYGRVQPLGITLGLLVDAINTGKTSNDLSFADTFAKAHNALAKNIADQTFLQGLNNIIKAVESDQSIKGQIVSSFITSWVPNVYTQTINSAREDFQDKRNYNQEFMPYVKEEINQLIPRIFNIQKGEYIPKVDLWGNDIKNQPTAPGNPLLWKIVMPVVATPAGMDKKDQMIWNYNKAHVNNEYWPSLPEWWFKTNNETHYFTKEQYHQYSKSAGEYAAQATENLIRQGKLNYENPTEDDMYVLKKVFSIAREKAKIETLTNSK